jgi:dipicolinate synthase subunit B
MRLSGVKIGFGLTGSHCTIEEVLPEMEKLKKEGAEIFPILSPAVAGTDTRFNRAQQVLAKVRALAGREPWLQLTEVEPIGPEKKLDIMVVAPCTGTTLARLAMGLSDTPVTLACKAHWRNERPVVAAIATNDGLGGTFQHLAALFNRKFFFVVPFRQDNPVEKPKSLVSKMELLPATVEAALRDRQLQPVLLGS